MSRQPFSVVPGLRIGSMTLMLVLLGLVIYQFRAAPVAIESQGKLTPVVAAPQSVEDLRSDDGKSGGAEDRVPDFPQFLRESEAITDRSLTIDGTELPAYRRVLQWVDDESMQDLQAGPFSTATFQDLNAQPEKYRGQLFRRELLIRRVVSYQLEATARSPRAPLYELWGWPTQSDGWLYVVVTPELPPGFPIGNNIEATATVFGYFFKLQGYQPADAKPNARPLVAPLLIGRIERKLVMVAPSSPSGLNWAIAIVGGTILVAVIASWFVAGKRKSFSHWELPADLPPPDNEDDSRITQDSSSRDTYRRKPDVEERDQ